MRMGIAPFLSGFCILALAPLAGAQEPAHQPLVAIDYLYPLTAEYGLPSRILIDYVERAFNAKYRQWGAHQLLADESLELPPHVAKAAWSFVSGGEGAGTWLWIDGELVTKYWWNWKTLPEVITQRTGFRAKEVGVRLLEMGPHDVRGPASGAGETLLALWGLVGFLVCDGPQQIAGERCGRQYATRRRPMETGARTARRVGSGQ